MRPRALTISFTLLALTSLLPLPASVARSAATTPPAPGAPARPAPDSADTARARWALVLSGGVARGFAHGGVIQALEEERTRPDLVVGSSMGAIVGAMYAAGFTADSMRAILREIPWDIVFTGLPTAYQWRAPWPPPWFELVSGQGSALSIPATIVDNSVINEVLVELFLDADAVAQGDFDRLQIPFRTLGTDIRTGRWVMLDHGSIARACRISSGLPLLFPPVAVGDALLVDGGMSSNLPISPARAAGAERVLAVDVALPYPDLDESSSGLIVFMQLWDILNKRGQTDTVSVAAGDTLVWLRLPDAGPADFAGGARMIDQGYAEAGTAVRSWARRAGLPRTEVPLVSPSPVMPPLAAGIEWSGRASPRRTATARRVLGRLPEGPFRPRDLTPGLRQLMASGLFESAWPGFSVRGDSTVLSFEVRERPELAVGPAFAIGSDEGGRLHLGLTYRPDSGPLPSLAKLGWTWRELGWTLQASLEPHALDHGGSGVFVRGRAQNVRARVFEGGRVTGYLTSDRDELFLGAQLGIARRQALQVAVGVGTAGGSGPRWRGPLLAFRTGSLGRYERLLEGEWGVGGHGYARLHGAFDQGIPMRWLVLRPGVRFGAVDGEPAADALVGLGGPRSLSGLHYDEWLGRGMWAGSLELALEASRQARAYVSGQIGRVYEPVSGADLGPDAVIGLGVGAQVDLPIGPLRVEWGISSAGRDRIDIILGGRF
jgi:predicted acylesterase/phospholipase RssA